MDLIADAREAQLRQCNGRLATHEAAEHFEEAQGLIVAVAAREPLSRNKTTR
jgi:hypothetical protein